jgi:acid phosphatase
MKGRKQDLCFSACESTVPKYTSVLHAMLISISVHDGDIIPVLSVLDLLPVEDGDLPTSHVKRTRSWRTSDLVPMGGRIIIERLVRGLPSQCWDHSEFGYPNHRYCSEDTQEHFVRININDGIVALPWCHDGPGSSCPLEAFLEWTGRKGKRLGDFRTACGLPKSAKAGIEFLHQ